MNGNMRRLGQITLTYEFIYGYPMKAAKLLSDCVVIDARHDHSRSMITYTLMNSEFPIVPEGQSAPQLYTYCDPNGGERLVYLYPNEEKEEK